MVYHPQNADLKPCGGSLQPPPLHGDGPSGRDAGAERSEKVYPFDDRETDSKDGAQDDGEGRGQKESLNLDLLFRGAQKIKKYSL